MRVGTRWAAAGAVLALLAAGVAWWVSREPPTDHTLSRPGDLPEVTAAVAAAVPDAQTDAHVPDVAVAVVADGEVAWRESFGAPAGTVFQAGSISKTVGAAAVLALADDGVLDLDAPVSTYLRSWSLPDDVEDPEEVTLRRLLSHTAGFGTPGYEGVPADRPLATTAESLAGATTGEPVRQSGEPGAYAYSGGGYTIVQQAVEDVTGQPFSEVVAREVLDPLGMTASGYACTQSADLEPGAASGHLDDGTTAPRYRYAEQAAAGLCTTVDDLAAFAAWLGSSDPRAVAMRRPEPGTDGRYGLGVETDEAPTVGHVGVNRGFHAELLVHPDAGVGLVVLTDGDRGGEVVEAVLDAWHGAD